MTKVSGVAVGAELTASRTVTDQDIARCAQLTGDFGAHHVTGMAGRPIAQGLLTAAVAPLLRGDDGFHLRSMAMRFLAPVYSGDTVTATVRVTDAVPDPEGGLELGLELTIDNQDETSVITGVGTGRLADTPIGPEEKAS